MIDQIKVGDQTYTYDGGEEFGAVRKVYQGGRRELVIYIENAGEFVVPLDAVKSVHSGKVILDYSRLDRRLQNAIDHAHDAEKPDAQSKRGKAPMKNDKTTTNGASILQPGATAPDFNLKCTPDQFVTLNDFRGRPLIIAFYPADWSPVCGDQLALYNEVLPEFKRFDAALVGISVDGAWCHAAYARDRKLHFPLLADFEPKGETARSYGAYRRQDGVCERALFVIDSEGTIRWSYLSPIGVNPGADGILSALEALAPQQQRSTREASRS